MADGARSALELDVFCANHSIPHENCPQCLTTVAAMRPTIFAELAAAELRSGTECCRSCDFVYHEVIDQCPRCGEPHPFLVETRHDDEWPSTVLELRHEPVADLETLTLRDISEPKHRAGW